MLKVKKQVLSETLGPYLCVLLDSNSCLFVLP